jgi:hypothetical protein
MVARPVASATQPKWYGDMANHPPRLEATRGFYLDGRAGQVHGRVVDPGQRTLRPQPAAEDGSHLRGPWNFRVTSHDPDVPLDRAIDCYAQVGQSGARANWVLRACLRHPIASQASRVRCPNALLNSRDRLTPNNLALQGSLTGPRASSGSGVCEPGQSSPAVRAMPTSTPASAAGARTMASWPVSSS